MNKIVLLFGILSLVVLSGIIAMQVNELKTYECTPSGTGI